MFKKRENTPSIRRTLLGAFIRSLFLESSWNNRGKQNLGYASVMGPILQRFFQGKTNEKTLLKPFNTNPIMSGLVFGAAIRLAEEQSQSGQKEIENQGLIDSLASVTGAQGDQIFWNTWLPFAALLAFTITYFVGGLWGPVLLPILFSILAWPVRFWGFFWGYRQGFNVYSDKFSANFLAFRRRFHTFLFFGLGFLTAWVLVDIPQNSGNTPLQVFFLVAILFLTMDIFIRFRRLKPGLTIPSFIVECIFIYFLITYLI
ncbi:MAG: PTS system mannose/fructose/sorbose family transporter subunit IID [Deltaproteobacteria bacterium]|jgi:PTS system mannose-specific IID component|nr:PTS system mannose/fructose/sorbose family transporter subunit IID [Deltaproteobacteria bacterium]